VTEVEINGHRYRYEYDSETQATVYKGPVGDAPALSEEEFFVAVTSKRFDMADFQERIATLEREVYKYPIQQVDRVLGGMLEELPVDVLVEGTEIVNRARRRIGLLEITLDGNGEVIQVNNTTRSGVIRDISIDGTMVRIQSPSDEWNWVPSGEVFVGTPMGMPVRREPVVQVREEPPPKKKGRRPTLFDFRNPTG
jgi:hypothetical protein